MDWVDEEVDWVDGSVDCVNEVVDWVDGSVDCVDEVVDWVDGGIVVGGDVHLMSRPVWISTAPSGNYKTDVTVKVISNGNSNSKMVYFRDVWYN